MAFAQLSRVRLEYFPHGDGPERVVFIHGFQASARIWRMVQQALPADRYASIAINNRGAGQSDAPPDEADFGVEPFAADAFELVEQLGWRDFTLVGHSMGGATAAQFAVDHPALLKGLILLDPADPDGRPLPPGISMEALLDARMAARREQLARGGAGDGVDASGAGANAELLQALAEDMRNAPERRLRGSMRSMLNVRLGERVRALPMPVMLAGGDADALIPLASMLATWAKLPAGSGLHLWHGIGHSPNLDCPDELAALIRRFVEQTIPARGAAAQPVAAG
ncbi:MAG TPA: alpha/beta hydrolase [Caulobacteraceae bacterium]|nr:alpha/beta hydrolase [Caulobacteraceae bacterium]